MKTLPYDLTCKEQLTENNFIITLTGNVSVTFRPAGKRGWPRRAPLAWPSRRAEEGLLVVPSVAGEWWAFHTQL